MDHGRLLARYGVVAALVASLSGCIITAFTSYRMEAGGTTFYQAAGSATFVPCVPTAVSGGTQVSCSLRVPGFAPWTILATLLGIAPNQVPTLWDPLILQVPLTAGNFSGTVNGPGGGSLTVTPVTGTLYADATTPFVPDPGTQLVIIDFTPGTSITTGTTYQFTLNFQTTGGTGGPLTVKFVFAGKITTPGALDESGQPKAATTYYPPLFPCTADFANVPAITLPTANMNTPINITPLLSQQGCAGKAYNFAGGTFGPIVEVVEFRHAVLDHYFITHVAGEIAILDAGVTIKGWTRTGRTFKAYSSPQAGSSEVCRFYIPPAQGDSHFFGRGTKECNDTATKFPAFTLEDPRFMHIVLPDAAGACPAGTVAVYRVFSGRVDANHRYMTDRTLRDQMVTAGWTAEGDGPDLVVMCAPA